MKYCQDQKFWRTFLIATLTLQFMFYGDALAQCNMDFFQVFYGPCEGATNTFSANGVAQFSNPPAGGVLTISANNGINSYDTIINPPFNSPQNWSISGQIPANGMPVTYSVTFSAAPGCTNQLTANAPVSCACAAEIGTFTPNLIGVSQNNYVLCFNDEFTLTATGGFVPPGEAVNPPGPPYSPNIGYLVYTCIPTIGLDPSNGEDVSDDPCLLGVIGSGTTFSSLNDLGIPPYAGGVNNTLYYVPITLYSDATTPLIYTYVNTNISCYELGDVYTVQYLPEVITNAVPNCLDGSVTVTVAGGLPAVDGSLFTASNLQPLTASFVNTTANNAADIVINGLQNGDMWSFDIEDENGCPHTVSGGPFVGIPAANAGFTDTICGLAYNLSATPSSGIGSWSGDAGVSFTPNVSDPNATASVNAAGTYNITWTENNGGGCIDSDDITITYSNMSIPAVITDVSCFNAGDGQVVVAPQGGIAPYSYSWTSGGNAAIESNLPQGPVIVTVSDQSTCTLDSTFIINQPNNFTFTTDSENAICDQPNGWAAVIGISGANGNYVYDWGAGFSNNDTLFNATPGLYNVIIADNNGIAPFCDTTVTFQVFNTVQQPTLASAVTDALCNTSCDGEAAIIPTGMAPFVYTWTPIVTLDSLGVGLCAGQYDVEVADANGCTATISVFVGSPPPLNVTIFSDDSLICITDSVILGADVQGGTPPYQTYFWTADPLDPTLDSDTITPLIFPADTTAYTLVVTDDNGCLSDPVSHQIDVFPPFVLDVISPFGGSDTMICPYDTAFIDLAVTGGDGSTPTFYSWPDTLNPIVLPFQAQPPVDSTYVFMATDGCILPAFDSVTVGLHPLPPLDIEQMGDSSCIPAEVTFAAVGLPNPSSVTWDFGDPDSGDNLGIDLISTHTYEHSGSYDVTITAVSDQGCIADTTYTNYITVFPNPVSSFTVDPRVTTILNPSFNFEDASFNNINSWLWDFGDGSGSVNPDPRHLYEDTGTYVVTLHVTNIHGCSDISSREIRIDPDFTFYVPNAFSPNFDGINDTFRGEGQGFHRDSYEFNIYNRWGDNIYSTANFDNRWDGTYQGREVESAVYVYRIELVDFALNKHVFIGHVTLYR